MWTHYLRCDECGVDAGKACRDEHDREALEVCDGRVLRVGDSADRCRADRGRSRQDKPPDPRPQVVSRRARGILAPPTMAPCEWCGTPTRLWGAACATGTTWCSTAECQTHRKRAKWARERAAAKAKAPPVPHKTRPCVICSAPVSAHGVNASNEAACPGACRRARRRQRIEMQNARDRAARAEIPPLSCAWCAAPVPRADRDPRERACCGAVECVEARRVGYRPRQFACSWCKKSVGRNGRREGTFACCGDQACRRAQIRAVRSRERSKAVSPAQHMDA